MSYTVGNKGQNSDVTILDENGEIIGRIILRSDAEKIVKALEKQEAMAVIDKVEAYICDFDGTCSECGYVDLSTVQGQKYCPGCGQKLDWE